MSTPAFHIPVRVYWEDTDAGGVVYHARYVAFAERARSEWMRALGYGQAQLRDERDLAFVIRSMQLDFRKPARLDDLLSVSVELRQCRRASLVIDQAITRAGERLFAAEVKLAALRFSDFTPCAIPDWLQMKLSPLIPPSPVSPESTPP